VKARTPDLEGLRPHSAEAPFLERVPGSVLYTAGRTKVLCTAIFEEGVPAFREGGDEGWTTAEYDLLPGSTAPRHSRERGGKISGRTAEIQRIIGRSLRAAIDLAAFPGWTLKLDCDVLEADGGTRTASINGAWIAAALALRERRGAGGTARPALNAMKRQVASLGAGLSNGQVLLDMDYEKDCRADVDLTLVLDTGGGVIEIQGTAEREPFSHADLLRMIARVRERIGAVYDLQRAIAGA
jgi:ribonuclease PH